MQNLGQLYWISHKYTKALQKKLTFDVLIFKIVLKDWKIITLSNIEHTYEPCTKMNKIKCFLKQVKLVKNITFNSIKLIKIFRVTMLSLKYVEKVEGLGTNSKSELS